MSRNEYFDREEDGDGYGEAHPYRAGMNDHTSVFITVTILVSKHFVTQYITRSRNTALCHAMTSFRRG